MEKLAEQIFDVYHNGDSDWNDISDNRRRVWKVSIAERFIPLIRAYIAERVAEAEILVERWQAAYFQDEGITPNGELRPLVIKLVKRAEDLQAEIANLKAQQAERVREAVEAEREACAKIGEVVSDYVARTIRARGKSEAER